MKQNYYIIIQNNVDFIKEIGEFHSIIEAEKYAYEHADNLAHGEAFIVIAADSMLELALKIMAL